MDRLGHSASLVTVVLALACGDAAREETSPTTADGSSGGDDSITSLTTVISTGVSDSATDDPTTDSPDDSTGGSSGGSSSESTSGEPAGSSESTSGGSSSDDASTGDRGATIYDIQEGRVPTGTEVEVFGVVVTGVGSSGLFVQEPGGGPYSGIFVFTGGMSGASIGDEVDVSGVTAEADGLTEIATGMGGSVNPTGASGIAIAPEVVDLAELAVEDTAEPWEGVLVRIEGTLAVEALPGFSEFDVGDGTSSVRIDNFIYSALGDPVAFPGLGLGSGFTAIQGPLHYTFAAFKIAPRSAADLEGYEGPDWTAVDALQPGDLVITEIMYNPSCLDDDCEWIEVWNATAGSVNLAGLRIQDSALGAECTIGVEVIVPAGGYAWLSTDDAGGWPYAAAPHAFCTGAFPGFNNSGSDSAAILNASGIVDQTAAYTASATGNGRSWKLQPGSLDAVANDQAGNWCYSTVVFDSPNGNAEQGSPGVANEVACAP